MSERNFEAELLYFGHGRTSGTTMHSHPYFQLEYCIGGMLPAAAEGRSLMLRPGDYWLIPPGTRHKFGRNDGTLDYISIKFASPLVSPLRPGHDPVCRYFLEKIRAVVDSETGFTPYGSEGKGIIENHLSGFLRRLEHTTENAPASKFETELHAAVCDLGARSNVNDLAERVGMTRAEFKYRFRQETGSGRIKDYVDAILLKIIEQHLRYSDTPLTRLAEQLHFSSIYAFSRYYKQRRGLPPSEFRNRPDAPPESSAETPERNTPPTPA